MGHFPRIFAILKEDVSHLYRFSIYRAGDVSDDRTYRCFHIDTAFKCALGNQTAVDTVEPSRVSISFQHLTRPAVVVGYWNTGMTILCPSVSDEPIPLYDFLHRDHLFIEPYNQVCESLGTTMIRSEIITRAAAFKWIHRFWQPWIHEPPTRKEVVGFIKARPGVGTIPPFVIEALIQKDSGQECSISFTPLKNCRIVSAANCFHCFEKEAIEEWLKTNRECPACRQPIQMLSEYQQMV